MGDRFDDELTRPLEGAVEASTAEGATSPAVGRDEWVARHGERRTQPRRRARDARAAARDRAVVGLARALHRPDRPLPGVSDSGYIRRVAFDTVVFILLALGLNIVVGWGGLLDLGYVAFYGIGAYAYALLSSEQYGIHLPTIVTIPLVVAHRRARRAGSSACRRDASPGTTWRS